jgi:SAM-dependent methyltransferase
MPELGSSSDAPSQREELLEHWERSASGWARHASDIQRGWMAVSVWMIDRLELQRGETVLELAAGPGDTGFLAAELIAPGRLISSDGVEAMLEIARSRARELGIYNVDFRLLELEWIDLPTASVDAILCRFGLMLAVDPAASLQEMRRVLRPSGRVAIAVWDEPARNPWSTIPTQALVELGHLAPPDRSAPGMFALAAPGRLQHLLEAAGFVEPVVEAIELERSADSLDAFLAETLDLSRNFADPFERLSAAQRDELRARIAALAAPFADEHGALRFPARALVAAASA